MLTTVSSNRLIYIVIFLFCSFSVSYAFYAEYSQFIIPCPLCIAERVIYIACGCIALIATLHNPKRTGNYIYLVLLLPIALFGIKISYHHVWLQNLPEALRPQSCGMPLAILYKQIPLSGFIHTVLSGSAECAIVSWKIMGIAAPKVSLAGFILITILVVIQFVRNIYANSATKSNHNH